MKKALLTLALLLAGSSLGAAPITVGGQVLDADGKPIAGAQVSLFPRLSLYERLKASSGGPLPPTVTAVVTDAAGRFRLQAPEPGMWRVRVEARGGSARKIELLPLLEPTELPPVRLDRDRGLEVRVVDAEGKPVPGAEVEVYPAPSPPGDLWGEGKAPSWEPTWVLGTSGTDGHVVLPWGSKPPQYVVGRAPGFRRTWIEGIAGGSATLRLDRGCERVLEIVDHRGRPVAGALVDGGSHAFGPSGEDGRITVHGLCEEATWVVATRDGRRAEPAVPAPSKEAHLSPFRVTLPPPPPSLQGRVLSAATREPLSGALVWPGDDFIDFVRTDAQGRYSIALEDPQILTAAASGHFQVHQRPRGAREAYEGPSFALPPASAVLGSVVDEQGRPVAGAELTYHRAMTMDSLSLALPKPLPTRSGADGRFRLMVPATDAVEITATHEEFSPERVSLPLLATSTLRPDVKVVLKKGAMVFGTVVDENGQPLAGARVSMRLDSSGSQIFILDSPELPEVRTDARGRFSIERLPPGHFDLVGQADGLAPGLLSGIEVREGRTELDPLVLRPGVTLDGSVVDTEGKPIEGAKVGLYPQEASNGESEATTGPDGSFTFSALRPGRVLLSVVKAGYRWNYPKTDSQVEVPASRPIRIVLERAYRVTGRVVDERGRPVPDAYLVFPQGQNSSTSMSADREGFFEFSDAGPGPLVLEAMAPGFRSTKRKLSIEGRDLEDLEVVLHPGSWIVGRVVDERGTGLPGARVWVLDSEFSDQTDGEGRFRLEGLEPGAVTVTAQHSEYQRAVRDLEVRLGENRVDLVLEGGHEVRGRVKDAATGRPVPGVRVHLYSVGISRRMENDLQTGTAEDGSFAFPSVPSGEYSAGAFAEGYRPASLEEPVRVADGPVEGLEIRLKTGGTGRIRGRVLGIESSNPGEVWVHAAGPEDFRESGRVGSDGSYRIDRLPAGEWTVTAFSPEGTAEGRVTLAEGGEAELDLTFERGLILSGYVTRAGAPVEGLGVFAHAGGRPAQGTTEEDGAFQLRGLAPGPCMLMVSDPERGLLHQETLELAADREVRIELPVRRIAGQVVDAGDSSPIAGASVVLTLPEGTAFPPFERRATTGPDGGFVLDSLSEGRYRIVARHEEFAPAEAVVHLESGSDPEGMRLELGPAAGLILEILSPAGRAPQWVHVVLLDVSGRVLFHDQQPTGENGRVRISSAPAGRVRVLVAARGAATASLDLTVPAEPVRVLLTPESWLAVSIPELAKAGISGEVKIQGPDGQPHRVIQDVLLDRWPLEGGRTRIDQLPAGTWRLRATTPDGRSWEGTVTTVAGGSSEVILE